MMPTMWTPLETQLPPAGTMVEVITESGDQRKLYFDGMWWLPDKSMYVYFVPKFWRFVNE